MHGPLLDKRRTIAHAGFSRWLVPCAALAVHLSIGMAYGFSVFWLPLSRAVGLARPAPCPAGTTVLQELTATHCDWRVSTLGWTYTLFFVCLGSSAAVFGPWLEREGPRKAGVTAAACWGGGLLVAALGVYVHQIWLLWLGAGVLGGVGLGLGYLSPVSTLIKWFPDRRGMATGMAIMGFGGGAMIGSPLADRLMKLYATPTSVGVAATFATLGVVYFAAMMAGAMGYRLPPPGWQPPGGATQAAPKAMVTRGHVHVRDVHRTPQFWLLWAVLCLNVSAGIGILGMASPMLQEVFGARLLGLRAGAALDAGQRAQLATVAAAFTGLLSLFNIGGRFGWASLSDLLGRKVTYGVFFALGVALYALAPAVGRAGNVPLFVAIFCVILTMYGGGFATIPAYLADLFGTRFVGAIHGRLLTAWSTAGVVGPVVVNYLREAQLARGVAPSQAYNVTLYVLAALLAAGFVCNLLVRPVAERFFMTPEEVAASEVKVAAEDVAEVREGAPTSRAALALAWAAVAVPMAWGVAVTLQKAARLFG